MPINIEAYSDRIRSAQDFDQLRLICIDEFTRAGAVMLSYHHLPPPGASDYDRHITVIAHGFPDAWLASYVENEYFLSDPIPKAALATSEPFWWSEAFTWRDLTTDETEYLKRMRDANLGDGLAVPVFGPFGRNGYAGIGFGAHPPALTRLQRMKIQWACQIEHHRYCELLRDSAPPDVILSKRETEILAWVARGKSNSVIAQIVGISAHTVDTHLRRVFVKLDVSDRVTAALRGLALGVIT